MTMPINRRNLLKLSASLAAGPAAATVIPEGPLASGIRGRVLQPGHPDYAGARPVASHNPRTDKFPAFIVQCVDAADVAHAIGYARTHDLEIAVRSGGHDVMGQATTEGGVVIDTSPMQAVEIERTRVRCGAGVRAGQCNAVTQRRELAVPLGCHPNVGVAGLTLGGGMGWLLGRHGATVDSVRGFELVTADGQILDVSAQQHPDLFFALRGGGGNFGVLTRIDYEAVPLGEVTRGFFVYAADDVASFLQCYDAFMRSAPDELTAEVTIATAREPLVTLTFCSCAADAAARRSVAELPQLANTLASHIDRVPYAQLTQPPAALVQQFFGDAAPPVPVLGPSYNYWQGASIERWTAAAADTLAEALAQAPAGFSIGLGHFMHGKILADDHGTPLVRRQGSMSYFFNIDWRGLASSRTNMAWVDQSIAHMQTHSQPAYVNYLSDGGAEAVAASYGPHHARLQDIKRRWDPSNVFHLNRNIPPAHRAG